MSWRQKFRRWWIGADLYDLAVGSVATASECDIAGRRMAEAALARIRDEVGGEVQ